VESGEIVARWRIATDPRRTADEYAVWLSQLMQLGGHDRNAVEGVIVATVVPRALHNLQVLASKYFNTEALIAGHAPVEWGISIDVDEPAS
ncbi:type III pantothenate kinase, partial [Klebsiella pneumoniae]|uniref:type III pantothenate kinase n=2 Tax=Pseudomonadota TaxID=1224 RepID=UPI00376F437B